MYRHFIHLIAIVAAAGLAHAQQAKMGSTASLTEVEDKSTMVKQFNLSVGDLEDMVIYSSGGEKIGEIDELLMNQEKEIVAASAEVGGFLDMGDKEVIVQLSQLRKQDDRLITDLTQEQLKSMPDWDN